MGLNKIYAFQRRNNVNLLHGKNNFAEGSKNFAGFAATDLKIILLDHQDNFVET